MSNDVVIKVENLSKLYRLGELHKQTGSFREKVTQSFSRTFRSIRQSSNSLNPSTSSTPSTSEAPDHIYALRNVSFEVKRGEIVGIIGRNGAGKSTLLKILSRITKPTEGRAWIDGRVGSLLEVGTGFHQELTGRENIFLNGAILGMTKAEIKRKFDEIVDFAEIEKFIDTPVKRYSSGMYVRLAFAVAAHLDPEILLVDEVLAVGDYKFQTKCIEKIRAVRNKGRTIIFVSHNMNIIADLCERAITLKYGKICGDGDPVNQIAEYLRNDISQSGYLNLKEWNLHRSGNGPRKFTYIALRDRKGDTKPLFYNNEKITFELGIEGNIGQTCLISIGIRDIQSRIITQFDSRDHKTDIKLTQRNGVVRISVDKLNLSPGIYMISMWLGDEMNVENDFILNCMSFHMCHNNMRSKKNKGIILFDSEWEVIPA